MSMIPNILKSAATTAVMGPPHWQSGICDCTQDMGGCAQTLCCTYCTMSNIQNMRDFRAPACDCGACCAIMFASYLTSYDSVFWWSFAFRRELVTRYGILNETLCSSCVYSTCCLPCNLCLVQREMGKRNEHVGGMCATPPPSQPNMAQQAMGAIIGGINGGGNLPRIWGSGVCGCNFMECLEGLFCYCCIVGYVGNKLDQGRVPTKALGGPNVLDIGSCIGSLFWPFGYVYATRREIIERYNIAGETHTMTCVNTICCAPCALCQTRREMGYANEWPGGLCVSTPPPKMV